MRGLASNQRLGACWLPLLALAHSTRPCPERPICRYDPYPRQLTKESYDHEGMQAARRAAIGAAADARSWGLVLGTLGRQGNPRILEQLQQLLAARGRHYVTVLLSGRWLLAVILPASGDSSASPSVTPRPACLLWPLFAVLFCRALQPARVAFAAAS